jgi:hypothetical protein
MKISPIVPLREPVTLLADGGLELAVGLSTDDLVAGQNVAEESIPAAKFGLIGSESRLF